MKIGYPCLNRSLECKSNGSFRLASFSRERFFETAGANLDCLLEILKFNAERGLLFFRISSDIIPFGSHPVLRLGWTRKFREKLDEIGEFIREKSIRISMHPDQFVVLNSPRPEVVKSSIGELRYHARFLDSLGLDTSAKIQIHIGGAYGDVPASRERFARSYAKLDSSVKRRLAIENDDRLFSLSDTLWLYERVGTPIIFDSFHHELLNHAETVHEALRLAAKTWNESDGCPMVDYSSQYPSGMRGKHAETLDTVHFEKFLGQARGHNFDLMLEIKDKEKSAQKALKISGKFEEYSAGRENS